MQFRLIDLMAYILLVSVVLGGMIFARSRALSSYGTDKALAQWETWREDAKEQSKGPVARRVPQSAEPPALVLMRDYFAVCTAIAVTLSSVLFITMLAFIRGALQTPAFVDRSRPEPGRNDRPS
jgi:hypothetical protein